MVKDPTDATPLILRQIQGTLAEHGQTLAEHGRTLAEYGRILNDHTRRFDGLDRLMQEVLSRLGDIRTSMVTVLGFVTRADDRHNELAHEIDDLKRRVGALEEKV